MHETIESFEKAAAEMKDLVEGLVYAAFALGEKAVNGMPMRTMGVFHAREYECDTVEERVLVAVSFTNSFIMGRDRTIVDLCPIFSDGNGFSYMRERLAHLFATIGRTLCRLDVVYIGEEQTWGLLVGLNR